MHAIAIPPVTRPAGNLPGWRSLLLVCVAPFALDPPSKVNACTLWGAAGVCAEGGTMISKNRDQKPDHTQVLKVRRGRSGYAYFGLYAEGGAEPGIKEGVNERGLAVITASASSIPKAIRDNQPGKSGIIARLLSECATCEEVFAARDSIFPATRAMFVMISDRSRILMAEVGLDGKFALREIANGTVVHTNHFLEEPLAQFNVKIGRSSTVRLDRITRLMEQAPKPHTIESFAEISGDRHDGPDNSLWRTGANERTLATWILQTPPDGAPRLRIVLANPGKPEETRNLVLDRKFWQEAN